MSRARKVVMNQGASRNGIVCIGEVLWDALPSGLFLGGAPLNVCAHLHRLGQPAVMVSRVGNDRLGTESCRRLERLGLGTVYLQTDPHHETGFVEVELDSAGNPEYDIVKPVAWDFIEISEAVKRLVGQAWALVYGSLAQRENSFVDLLTSVDAVRVFDLNLRPPHYRKNKILELMEHSDFVKMNEEELVLLRQWLSLPDEMEKAVKALSREFACETICVTRGGRGAVLLHENIFSMHPGYKIRVADAVGAGDAFLAGLLTGIRKGEEPGELLRFANAAGALVASFEGAIPDYTIQQVKLMMGR